MRNTALPTFLLMVACIACAADPRIREIDYDSASVVTVETKRGTVTHIELPAEEAIRFVASGQGAECRQPEMLWCIDGAPGQRNVFLKPRAGAEANTLSIVTDKRSYTFALTVLPDKSPKPATLRLVLHASGPGGTSKARSQDPGGQLEQLSRLHELLADTARQEAARADMDARLKLAPEIANTSYSLAFGDHSEEIAPTAVYDDGRFTYLRFPGNRELPAVFQVAEDASESIVNARVENDQLVVDRVAKRLVLRKGAAVVAVMNDEFDLNGRPPILGTTAPGVERVPLLKERRGRGTQQ